MKQVRRAFLTRMAALGASLALVPKALAQAGYPNMPIRILVAFAPGDSVDTVIRIVQPKLSELLGQPVIVENRPGAGTAIAAGAVTKAAADGYTLLFTASGAHVIHTIGQPQYQYEPIKDFTAIASISRAGWAFVVHPSLPVNSIAEYIAYAKANPNKISYGSSGIGAGNHLVMVRFNLATGIQTEHIPYKSSPNAVMDVAAGRLQAYFTSRSSLQPMIDAGRIRALAFTATQPGEFPASMSFAAAGFPEFDAVDTNNILLGPANLPPQVLGKLSAAIEQVLALPEIQASIAAQKQSAYFRNSQQIGERLNSDYEKYKSIIRDAKINMQG